MIVLDRTRLTGRSVFYKRYLFEGCLRSADTLLLFKNFNINYEKLLTVFSFSDTYK